MPAPAASAFCQRHLRLGDSLLAVDAGFDQGAGQIQRLPVCFDRSVIQVLQGILSAQFEVIYREIGLLGQTFVLEVRGADLRGILIFANRVADASPEVRLPGDIERQRNLVTLGLAGRRRSRR